MALTDVAIRNAKAAEKPKKLGDSGGLHLLVTPAGGKLWRVSYRFGRKQKTVSLGQYPEVSLAEARERLLETKKLLGHGKDPSVQVKLAKLMRSMIQATNVSCLIRRSLMAAIFRVARCNSTPSSSPACGFTDTTFDGGSSLTYARHKIDTFEGANESGHTRDATLVPRA